MLILNPLYFPNEVEINFISIIYYDYDDVNYKEINFYVTFVRPFCNILELVSVFLIKS